jgi:putative two-component system response regulator
VLVVDDQPFNLELVEEILSEEGFQVRTEQDGAFALRAVTEEPPDCVVLDIMMPGVDGLEVLRQLKSRRTTRFIPIVMLTAVTQVEEKVRSLELGADDFLTKPFIPDELVARVSSLVRVKRLRDELDTSESIIVSMVQALENKDPRSAGHGQRVARHAVRAAERLGLGEADVEVIAKAGVVHDLGKIGIPERVLPRAAVLSDDEQVLYRQHPVIGEQILGPLISFAHVRAIVRHHHECLDGSGFPDGISGDELDIPTELVAVANRLDDLVELKGIGWPEAAACLREEAARGRYRVATVEAVVGSEAEAAGDTASALDWRELLPLPTDSRVGRIVIGDATRSNAETIETILREEGHTVDVVSDGMSVLSAVDRGQPDLLLVDADLPGVDGFGICDALKSREQTRFLPVIIMTRERHDVLRRIGSRVGADDFLPQPVRRMELAARVRSLLRLRLYFRDLEEYQNVILSLASALEAKDPYTRGHSERVGVLASRLGKELGLSDQQCHMLMVAGQLHDVGKIGVPESLLNKPGRLDFDELVVVRFHAVRGEEICHSLRSVRETLPVIRHHHERFDGSGYPDGLAGEEIPFGARILGLADAFDALTSSRSYRGHMGTAEALELLESETAAGQWDPHLFSVFAGIVRRTMLD